MNPRAFLRASRNAVPIIALDPIAMSAAPDSDEIQHGWMRLVVGRRPRRTLIRLVVTVVLLVVLYEFVFIPIRITGNSMHPTYRDGRVNLVNRLSYWHGTPARGDVVGLRVTGSRVMILKRIIGLPGERITVRKDRVFINGEELAEPYLASRVPWAQIDHVLKDHEYFVVGDNRAVSEYGPVSRSRIVGKILF